MDVSGFRRSTLGRRLLNRISAAHAGDAVKYLARLDRDEAEVDRLLASLTVKVSRFWRNEATFDRLREDVLPRLAARAHGRPLRLWSAGCGKGEEAYSLAMLLDGIPGEILATDIDALALDSARTGFYPTAAVAAVPPDLAAAHLEQRNDGRVAVGAALRERVRFAHHDLASAAAPPGAPFDLVACRNVLIYFELPLQEHVLRLLVDALAPGGALCLGESEWEGPAVSAVRAVDRQLRLFERIAS